MNVMRRVSFCCGFSAFLSVVASAALAAPTYQIDQLPQLATEYPSASPSAIGPNGVVVGTASHFDTESGNSKAVLWNAAGAIADLMPSSDHAAAADINSSGQVLITADAITYISSQGTLTPIAAGSIGVTGNEMNDAGQITGWFSTSGSQHAFIYKDGVLTDLGTLPGGSISYGYGINNNGQVVGASTNSAGQFHAVLWDNGAIVDLGTLPGKTASYARAINDAGQIVGDSTTGYPNYSSRAFLWANGVMTDLGNVVDNDYVSAIDINNLGQVIGSARTATQYRSTAFLWSNGTITNLNPVIGGAELGGCYASAINDAGQITGLCSGQPYRLLPTAAAVDVGVDMTTTPLNSVYQGSPLTYTIRVANAGSLPATNVNLTDVLPAQMSFVSATASQGSCAGSATVTCALGDIAVGATATVLVNVLPTATGYNINNTVTVSTSGVDVNSRNNSAAITITVREPLVLADLSVTTTAAQNPVPRRTNIVYTVNVKNAGPNTAQDVLLSDTLLDSSASIVAYTVTRGTCTNSGYYMNCRLGNMASGETATLQITVKPRYAISNLKYTNAASVSSKTQDSSSANNYATVTVTVK